MNYSLGHAPFGQKCAQHDDELNRRHTRARALAHGWRGHEWIRHDDVGGVRCCGAALLLLLPPLDDRSAVLWRSIKEGILSTYVLLRFGLPTFNGCSLDGT